MSARTDQGTGRPDAKMTRSEDAVKRDRFGAGTKAHQRVQSKANSKRRERDRATTER